jgi:roundabout axon guidance receptor 2
VLKENFQLEPHDLQLPAGEQAIFHCLTPKGNPAPRVSWRKEQQVIRAGFGRVQQLANGSLLIGQVRKSDQGKFVCVAENLVGVRESAPANLIVHGTLVIIVVIIIVNLDDLINQI